MQHTSKRPATGIGIMILVSLVLAVAAPFGHGATYAYDTNNRLSKISYNDGREASFTYDDMGNLTGVTTKLGAAPSVVATEPITGSVGNPIADYQIEVNRPGEVTGFQISGLPAGLKANTGKVVNADGKAPGVIYGTPTAGGVFSVKVAAKGAKTTGSPIVLTANIDNPFIKETNGFALSGKLSGLIDPSSISGGDLGGWLTVSLTSKGTFTGSVQLGKIKYSFKGMFDGASGGATAITIPRKNQSPLTLNLLLTMDGEGRGELTGTLSDGSQKVILGVQRQIWGKRKTPDLFGATPAVLYNIGIELDPAHVGDPDYPQGWGFVAMKVDKAGVAKFAGQLSDGTKITASSVVTSEGEVPVFISLYGGAGSVVGTTLIDPQTELSPLDNSVGGLLTWNRPAATKVTDRLYSKGFQTDAFLAGSAYTAPPTGSRVLHLGSSPVHPAVNMELTDGGLSAMLVTALTINTANKVTAFLPNDHAYKLTFTPKTGLFSGSFVPAAGTKVVKFSGLLIPDADPELDAGFGYFLNPGSSIAEPILSGGAWIGRD